MRRTRVNYDPLVDQWLRQRFDHMQEPKDGRQRGLSYSEDVIYVNSRPIAKLFPTHSLVTVSYFRGRGSQIARRVFSRVGSNKDIRIMVVNDPECRDHTSNIDWNVLWIRKYIKTALKARKKSLFTYYIKRMKHREQELRLYCNIFNLPFPELVNEREGLAVKFVTLTLGA